MADVFAMLAEGRFFVDERDGASVVTRPLNLLIYVGETLRVTLSRRHCTIEGIIPDTLTLAAVGRKLTAIVDPEILSWCPGASDATVTGVPPRPTLAEYYESRQADTTIVDITPIDVRQAKLHHVAWPTYDPNDSAENRIRKAFFNPQRPRPLVRYDPGDRIRPPTHRPEPR